MLLTDQDVCPCPRVYVPARLLERAKTWDPQLLEAWGFLELWPGAPLLARWASQVRQASFAQPPDYSVAEHMHCFPDDAAMPYVLPAEKHQELERFLLKQGFTQYATH